MLWKALLDALHVERQIVNFVNETFAVWQNNQQSPSSGLGYLGTGTGAGYFSTGTG